MRRDEWMDGTLTTVGYINCFTPPSRMALDIETPFVLP